MGCFFGCVWLSRQLWARGWDTAHVFVYPFSVVLPSSLVGHGAGLYQEIQAIPKSLVEMMEPAAIRLRLGRDHTRWHRDFRYCQCSGTGGMGCGFLSFLGKTF